MKNCIIVKRLTAAALALVLLLALAACGGAARERTHSPADTLKGIYEALIAPESAYSQDKALYAAYYPELEYTEALGEDRITLSLKANGNEYFTDGSWDFVVEGDWLTATIANDDIPGVMNVMNVAKAIGAYFGMETELIISYLNGLATLGIESDNFSVTEDEAAGATTYKLNISGPWDMKELDQMVLNETLLGGEALDENFMNQSGSLGKMRVVCSGNVNSYTMLFAEYGELDDIAYQSIVNVVTLRKPAGWEPFLADFTELKDLETDEYLVQLNPDDETVAEMMGARNEKFSYVLVRFGSEEKTEEDVEIPVPSAEEFADRYFRVVAGVPQGTAGASLAEAAAACDVLAFAAGSELWLADEETLRANMLAAWESLSDEERASFDESFPGMQELLNGCFDNWEENRGRFADAGVAESMEELLADETASWSWETLSSNTWTLGNGD